MLKELTKKDWMALLHIPLEKIPKILILRGTRNLKTQYAKHKAYLKDVLEIGSPNGLFEDICIGSYQDTIVGYASVYGDSMASEITHVFGVLGTNLVIQTGCCGALAQEILPGDIVCATTAHSGEGAVQYYTPQKREIQATPDLVEIIKNDWVSPFNLHKGRIWTTSALLAEGKEEIRNWSDYGYIAVDMESASTFAVAEYFGMKRLSILFVFDNLLQGEQILQTDVEKQERRAKGEQIMMKITFFLIHGLG
jgi:purine-nucleoside phosphorylase